MNHEKNLGILGFAGSVVGKKRHIAKMVVKNGDLSWWNP